MTALANTETDIREEFTIKRIYDAPAALLWAVWTEEAHIREWFGPKGFTSPASSVDLRPGGTYEVDMEGPKGFGQKAVYTIDELTIGERLVLEASSGDRSAGNYWRVNIVVEISDLGAQSQLVLTGLVMESQQDATGPLTGGKGPWMQSMDRLGEVLRNIQ